MNIETSGFFFSWDPSAKPSQAIGEKTALLGPLSLGVALEAVL
jgi:hypothetical protein